jgi:hypothetical protein
MAQAEQIDLTSLIASLQALTQVLGSNARTIGAILNSGFVPAEYFHIAGAGTFAVAANAGTLLSMNINQIGTGGTGTFYDARNIGSITGSLEVAVVNFGTAAPLEVPFGPVGRGLVLNNGLVVVTTGNTDITVGLL